MINQAQEHPFPAESLIMSLLLTQHKLIDYLKSMMQSKQTEKTNSLGSRNKRCFEFEDDSN